jgi:hypothetical protein
MGGSCGKWSVELNGAKQDEPTMPGYRDHEQFPEESARGGRAWRIFKIEECRLRLPGNSDTGRLGGSCGRRGGGGRVAPDSARRSVVTVERDGAAAAHGGVMQRCLDMSNIMVMSAGSLTRFAHLFLRPRPE